MGSGKTAIVSRALPDFGGIVIVAPLRVCASVWPRELQRWAPKRTFCVLQGTEQQRKEALYANAEITILNYELIPWAVENGVFTGCRCLVLDELSRLKGHQGSTFKALRKVLPKIPVRWGMTGTLISQGVIDAWAQTWCLDLGARLGRSFASFTRDYLIQGREYWDLQPQPGAEERIARKITDLVYRIEPSEYADTLPPLVIEHLPVAMPAGCLDGYRRLARDMTLGPSIVAGSRGVLTGKLQQYAQGAVYPLPELGERQPAQWYHHAKLDAARAFLDDLDEPCIVVYQYLFELEALRETNKGLLLGGGVTASNAAHAIEEWNAGRLPVLYLHGRSSGHGVNLQAGGRRILWLGPPWSLDLWLQVNARLHRSGAEGPTVATVLVADGTVDLEILATLVAKGDVAEAVENFFKIGVDVGF
jgi:SNF2 family DNA or RNA helicase